MCDGRRKTTSLCSYYISHEHTFRSTTRDKHGGNRSFPEECLEQRACHYGLLCDCTGVALPFISPFTKYSAMINSAVPYNYPVPVRDDGDMPDVPAHPCEPKGNNLEWLKNL
ncbi:NADH dehydrogenase [ubiquinone] 1 alpha subcomplex subunit 3 isoform X1 [Platichthys flesus]|uniref:NADH dehydrogenase [ubiquinone] 1 alpha subcomplex subunit 3 isoform X1 n=1 Tax=Platichthys flesus TaxID=8260 RepID=UPI002DB72A0D|nr:NADH dehydrogenase [ubiquinone] 1 alpha subcomplex subunit 3 isoform X1 [Platichthys flesus]